MEQAFVSKESIEHALDFVHHMDYHTYSVLIDSIQDREHLLRKMLGTLKRLEWSNPIRTTYASIGRCPVCTGIKTENWEIYETLYGGGHEKPCWLYDMIAEVEELLDE